MLNQVRPALSMIVLFTALLGIGYPLAVTGVAEAMFAQQAHGNLVSRDGKPVGSALIGQAFSGAGYFHGRPSATADMPYNAAASAGTSLGPTSAKLRDMVAAEAGRLAQDGLSRPLPADAVTASGSGLDPDISPAYAELQIARVAKARQVPEDAVRKLVTEGLARPALGFIGEPRVNVLNLNMALDKLVAPQ